MPPWGMASRALRQRLTRTWCNSVLLPWTIQRSLGDGKIQGDVCGQGSADEGGELLEQAEGLEGRFRRL